MSTGYVLHDQRPGVAHGWSLHPSKKEAQAAKRSATRGGWLARLRDARHLTIEDAHRFLSHN